MRIPSHRRSRRGILNRQLFLFHSNGRDDGFSSKVEKFENGKSQKSRKLIWSNVNEMATICTLVQVKLIKIDQISSFLF
jgi:hypothetical protein